MKKSWSCSEGLRQIVIEGNKAFAASVYQPTSVEPFTKKGATEFDTREILMEPSTVYAGSTVPNSMRCRGGEAIGPAAHEANRMKRADMRSGVKPIISTINRSLSRT